MKTTPTVTNTVQWPWRGACSPAAKCCSRPSSIPCRSKCGRTKLSPCGASSGESCTRKGRNRASCSRESLILITWWTWSTTISSRSRACGSCCRLCLPRGTWIDRQTSSTEKNASSRKIRTTRIIPLLVAARQCILVTRWKRLSKRRIPSAWKELTELTAERLAFFFIFRFIWYTRRNFCLPFVLYIGSTTNFALFFNQIEPTPTLLWIFVFTAGAQRTYWTIAHRIKPNGNVSRSLNIPVRCCPSTQVSVFTYIDKWKNSRWFLQIQTNTPFFAI